MDLKALGPLVAAGKIVLYQPADLEQSLHGVATQPKAFTLDSSRLDGDEGLGGPGADEILRILGRGSALDANQLYTAYLNGCDYFLTRDLTDFIRQWRRERLEAFLRIKIRTTEEFVAEVAL